jgi:hypothetical protein
LYAPLVDVVLRYGLTGSHDHKILRLDAMKMHRGGATRGCKGFNDRIHAVRI